MQFHPVSQGSSIVLDMGGRRATRDVDSFCNGVVFSKVNLSTVKVVSILSFPISQFPLSIGSVYCLEIGSGGDWSGSLRLGVTIHSPTQVPSPPPRYACPDLIARDGYWARPVKESLAVHGARISFCLCPGGDVRLFVNNHHIGRHLTNIPTSVPVWALMDVYGNTTSITFVKEGQIKFLKKADGNNIGIYRVSSGGDSCSWPRCCGCLSRCSRFRHLAYLPWAPLCFGSRQVSKGQSCIKQFVFVFRF